MTTGKLSGIKKTGSTDRYHLSVREIQPADIELIIRYWLESAPDFLTGMGVDLEKLPTRDVLSHMLQEQLNAPICEKKSYCIIWQVDDHPVGHSNINKIIFGKEASMHLHVWDPDWRRKGIGTELVKLTLPYYFKNFRLEKIYCEPYALNPAPNKTLEKAGFRFVKKYITVPGSLNFEQPVNRWEITSDELTAI